MWLWHRICPTQIPLFCGKSWIFVQLVGRSRCYSPENTRKPQFISRLIRLLFNIAHYSDFASFRKPLMRVDKDTGVSISVMSVGSSSKRVCRASFTLRPRSSQQRSFREKDSGKHPHRFCLSAAREARRDRDYPTLCRRSGANGARSTGKRQAGDFSDLFLREATGKGNPASQRLTQAVCRTG
jgi:hypothetical protein